MKPRIYTRLEKSSYTVVRTEHFPTKTWMDTIKWNFKTVDHFTYFIDNYTRQSVIGCVHNNYIEKMFFFSGDYNDAFDQFKNNSVPHVFSYEVNDFSVFKEIVELSNGAWWFVSDKKDYNVLSDLGFHVQIGNVLCLEKIYLK